MDAKHPGNIFLETTVSIEISDFKNLFIGQFGHGVPRPFVGKTFMGAMLDAIQAVFALCAPGKVLKKVIGAFPISVTTFVSNRAGSCEGFKDKSMDFSFVVPSFFGQTHSEIAVVNFWLQNPPGSCSQHEFGATHVPHALVSGPVPIRPNPSLIRNIITGEIRDWFENFIVWVKIEITHGLNLLQGLSFGEGRIPARTGVRPVLFILPQPTEMAI